MVYVTGTVEFVYDFVSIPCHIAWKSLDPMIKAIGAEVVMTPVLCGGIFKAVGSRFQQSDPVATCVSTVVIPGRH